MADSESSRIRSHRKVEVIAKSKIRKRRGFVEVTADVMIRFVPYLSPLSDVLSYNLHLFNRFSFSFFRWLRHPLTVAII